MKLISYIKNFSWPAFIVLIHSACVEPYTPPVTKDESNLLVVEGYINTTTNAVQVKLSRTIALAKKQVFPAELKASLSIESEDGVKIPLVEKTEGNYEKTGLSLNTTKKYRLRIVTKTGSSYSSPFIGLNPTPVMDTLAWKADETGTTIYVNAHDPAGLIKYYKFNYTETWQYTSVYQASFKVVNSQVIRLTPAEDNHTCWNTIPAPNLLLASTAHLTQNIVQEFPITFIPVGSLRVSLKYSILVSLRGIDEAEYDYWQTIQKTTEDIGGLYDPLPTQTTGNMHNDANASEKVLGYFSGGGMQEKRIYIWHYDLPKYLWPVTRPYCYLDTVTAGDAVKYGNGSVYVFAYPGGYLQSSLECTDCRVFGGVTTKPPFWP